MKKILLFLIVGLFLVEGCKEAPFDPESEIMILSVQQGDFSSVYVNRVDMETQDLGHYLVTVTFRILNNVDVVLNKYRVDYYREDGTHVDSFFHKGKRVTLTQEFSMNKKILGPTPPGEEPTTSVYVITQRVIDYAKENPDLAHLRAKVSFSGEDENDNLIEVVGNIGIEFYTV